MKNEVTKETRKKIEKFCKSRGYKAVGKIVEKEFFYACNVLVEEPVTHEQIMYINKGDIDGR